MLTREDLIASVAHEVAICKHLFTKLPPNSLDYRPTPTQRSMRELLLYIPSMLSIATGFLITGDRERFMQTREAHMQRNPEDFPQLMDEGFADFKQQIEAIPEEDFLGREVKLPTGQTMKLGAGLINFTFKFAAAYKLQLFLYLKQLGCSDLNTANAWAGRDSMTPVK